MSAIALEFVAMQFPESLAGELGVIVLLLLAAAGPALRCYAPRHRYEVEERVKDGRMTEAEARRQIRFLRGGAVVLSLLGIGLLVVHFSGVVS